MGKKRAAAADAPVFPFPAAAAAHFSDYGFDPQLIHFFLSQSQPETNKRSSTKRHHIQPPPLESARFKLQKPVSISNSKKQRRRWWSSAASAALVLFKRQSSSSSSANLTAARPSPRPAMYAAGPLYLADAEEDEDRYGYGNGDSTWASCACWAPAALRSAGHLQLTAAELGAASAASVPYVSLRNADCSTGAEGGGAAPAAMPIYLVT